MTIVFKIFGGVEFMIRITDKDLLLFKYLFETDFLTRPQIDNFVYEELSSDYVNKIKLWKLTKEGYLKKKMSPTGNTVLLATEKALDQMFIFRSRLKDIKRNDNFKFYYVDPVIYRVQEELDLRKFEHDRLLNTVRFKFENYGADYWLSDKLLYRRRVFKTIPDGTFQKKGKVFAVELEHTLKKKSRYRDIFNIYSKTKEIDYIIYITTSEMIYNALDKLFNPSFISYTSNSYKKFFLISLNDFLKGNLEIVNSAADLKFNLKEVLGDE